MTVIDHSGDCIWDNVYDEGPCCLFLRKEVYDDDSRTPEMEFGTVQEGSHRRDATINALFFDLVNHQVVDLTRKGLEDLSARIMRTPLERRQTFLNDPLRVCSLVELAVSSGIA